MNRCPICNLDLSNPLPSFCSQCGWDLKTDPTLVPSLDRIPDKVLEEYRQRVAIVKKSWNEKVEALKKQKALEKKIRKLQTEKKKAESGKEVAEQERRKMAEENRRLFEESKKKYDEVEKMLKEAMRIQGETLDMKMKEEKTERQKRMEEETRLKREEEKKRKESEAERKLAEEKRMREKLIPIEIPADLSILPWSIVRNINLETWKTKEALRFIVSDEGIITDTKTNLQWFVRPDDESTTWVKASSWVRGLLVGGGGWRMPTRVELEGIYFEGMGDRNMHQVFKTTGGWIWSGELAGSHEAWVFRFYNGKAYAYHLSNFSGPHAFAVRDRRLCDQFGNLRI